MKKREFDVFGILLGVVIGCILGFFLSTRINLNTPEDDELPVIGQVGNIFLLQLGKFENSTDASDLIKQIKIKDLHAIYVKEDDEYYVYSGISSTEEGLTDLKAKFSEEGFNAIIKKEYILDKPNAVIEDQTKFEFWSYCIDNLFNSLDGKAILIKSEYMDLYENHTLIFSDLTSLSSPLSDKLLLIYQLNLYKDIIETLD